MERYSITIDDAVMKKVRENAEHLKMPINMYLSNFIAESHTDSNISFDKIMKDIYAEIELLPKGKFILNDLKSFKNIKGMEFDGVKIKPTALRPRIGRTVYFAVSNNKLPNVKVVYVNNEVAIRNHAVLYEKV